MRTRVSPLSFVRFAGKPRGIACSKSSTCPLRAPSKKRVANAMASGGNDEASFGVPEPDDTAASLPEASIESSIVNSLTSAECASTQHPSAGVYSQVPTQAACLLSRSLVRSGKLYTGVPGYNVTSSLHIRQSCNSRLHVDFQSSLL